MEQTARSRHLVSDEQAAEIARRTQAGQPFSQIVREVGLPRALVSPYFRAAATPKAAPDHSRAPMPPELVREVARRLAAGERSFLIGRALNIPGSTVANYAQRFGSDPIKGAEDLIAARAASPNGRARAAATTTEAAPVATDVQQVADTIASDSLKRRVLRIVCERGPYSGNGVVGILHDLGMPVTDPNVHAVAHLLRRSLNVQGLVALTVRGRDLEVRATRRGYVAAGYPEPSKSGKPFRDSTNYRMLSKTAKGGPIERRYVEPILPPVPETAGLDSVSDVLADAATDVPTAAEPDTVEASDVAVAYPILEALRARQAAKVVAAARAQVYLDAAALLEDIDPAEAEHLMGLAAEEDGKPLSAVEIEYLAFAEAHHGG